MKVQKARLRTVGVFFFSFFFLFDFATLKNVFVFLCFFLFCFVFFLDKTPSTDSRVLWLGTKSGRTLSSRAGRPRNSGGPGGGCSRKGVSCRTGHTPPDPSSLPAPPPVPMVLAFWLWAAKKTNKNKKKKKEKEKKKGKKKAGEGHRHPLGGWAPRRDL